MAARIRSQKSKNEAQKAFEAWVVQFHPTLSGDQLLPYRIETSYGPMLIGFEIAPTRTYELNGSPRADWLNCVFENPSRAKGNVKMMNPFTGKWNHQIFIDKTAEGLKYIFGEMQYQGIITE